MLHSILLQRIPRIAPPQGMHGDAQGCYGTPMQRLLLIVLIVIGGVIPAGAAPPPADPALTVIMSDVRANNWPEAEQLAAQQPDRLVGKLVTYFRLLDPGAGSAQEIETFIVRNPDWPAQPALMRGFDAAVANEPDDTLARAECASQAIITAAADTRCAMAFAPVNLRKAGAFARAAWIIGYASPGDAARFFAQWQSVLTPDTDWARFRRFAMAGNARMAAATLPLLTGDHHAIGAAWLAVQKGATDAGALVAALPRQAQATPFLFFASLRAAPDPQTALALWQNLGATAEARATGYTRALFWPKREALARDLMQQGQPHAAYTLVAGAVPQSEAQKASQSFLAGFIALRLLHNPVLAHPWFAGLADISSAVITRARACYWLAQTETGVQANADLGRAAAFPDTFYGQLAAVQLGDTPAQLAARIRAAGTPVITPPDALRFAERELPQAALLLVQMGAPRRARAFLLQAAEVSPGAKDRFLAARLADGLGLEPTAVMVSRLAGSSGTMLISLGWPLAITPPGPAGPDVVLSITRQESSFEPNVVSPSGAEGLMQLMPGTARETAAKTGLATPAAAEFADPATNLALGSAYITMLMNRFGDCLPLAIAAYNGGPRNVENWLAANGDPRLPGTNIIDWIEEIPFTQTRNYVQRVTEGIVVYRALRTGQARDPITRWLPHS
jgi:soluble lytic murein transglycosylase